MRWLKIILAYWIHRKNVYFECHRSFMGQDLPVCDQPTERIWFPVRRSDYCEDFSRKHFYSRKRCGNCTFIA